MVDCGAMVKMGCCGYESGMEWINVSCAYVCLTRPSLPPLAHSLHPLFLPYSYSIIHPVYLARPCPRLFSLHSSALLDLVAIPLPLPFSFSVDIPLPSPPLPFPSSLPIHFPSLLVLVAIPPSRPLPLPYSPRLRLCL